MLYVKVVRLTRSGVIVMSTGDIIKAWIPVAKFHVGRRTSS